LSVLDFWKRVSAPISRISRRPPPPAEEELFDDDFQRKLDYLAIVSRRTFAGRIRAERRTKKSGSGVEFADHRDYVAGDDFRYLDWNVYQRFGRLLVRLYEEEEDLSIYLVIDSSSSMGFSSKRKFRYAQRLAAALAYVGLANLDRITIVSTTDRIEDRMPTARGKARIFKVLQFLRGLEPTGTTDLGDAMKTFVAQHKRRGLVIVLSDLYDPHGFERGINVLRYNKFEPFVLHVIDDTDSRLKLSGDVRIYDCETGDEREVTVTPKVLTQYRAAYQAYLAEIKKFCTERQVPYVAADVNIPFDELVLRVLRRGGFLT
jgi:uncharacterized protein (DUF58 family)